MNKLINILPFLLLILLTGCNSTSNSSSSGVDETEVMEDPNNFLDFYQKFHTDSAFQMEHIVFPLEGVPSVTDPVYDGKSKYYWQKEDWLLHRPIDTGTGEFRREFDIGDILITERILNSQNFMLVRRFYFNGTAWNLIYYADLNPIQ